MSKQEMNIIFNFDIWHHVLCRKNMLKAPKHMRGPTTDTEATLVVPDHSPTAAAQHSLSLAVASLPLAMQQVASQWGTTAIMLYATIQK